MKKKGFSLFLDYIAAIILGTAVLATLFTGYNYLMIPAAKIQTIEIKYHGVKTDSVNSLNKIEIKKIDSLLNEIKAISNNIQQAQLDVVEKKSDDSFYNKFYTAVVAIILALAGFFGFKSMSEVKTQALSDAKEEATKIAKEVAAMEFGKVFTDEFKTGVYDLSNKAMTDFLREQIGDLENRILLLEQRFENSNDIQDEIIPDLVEHLPDDDPPTTNTEEDIEFPNLGEVKNDLVEPKNPFENE
jgi:Rad52/22 family double-strand break repair protein